MAEPTKPNFIERIWDSFARFLVREGYIDKLSYAVTSTTMLRQLILAGAAYLTAHGIAKGGISEAIIGFSVTLLTALAGHFVNYMRNKYSREAQQAIQQAVPALKADDFIGPQSVAIIEKMAEASNDDLPAHFIDMEGTRRPLSSASPSELNEIRKAVAAREETERKNK